MTKLSFEQDAEISITDSALAAVSRLAKQQLVAEDEVETLTVKLAAAQQRLNQVALVDLPNVMKEHGLTAFTLHTGEKVLIKTTIKASIPKEHYENALTWLREHGHEGIIKSEVVTSFGKGEGAKSAKVVAFCDKNAIPYDHRETVHPQTLAAFVREQIEQGKPLAMEWFGVHELSVAKITRKK